jgi:Phasin protein
MMTVTTQQDKPGGKPRQRSRKAEQRRQKDGRGNGPAPDPRPEDAISPLAASTEVPSVEVEATQPPLVGEVLPPVPASAGVVEPADVVSLQAIVDAYADYARTSLQEGRSFVEKFIAVRSFDKAIELQSEFARLALSNFVAESQKICDLYSRWARQIFKPWEIASAKLTSAGRQAW